MSVMTSLMRNVLDEGDGQVIVIHLRDVLDECDDQSDEECTR